MIRSCKKGFTLIELLVVIAIIAILAAILFPVFSSAKEKGRQVKCTSNLRQLSMALISYADDNNGRFPETPHAPDDRWGIYYSRVYQMAQRNTPPANATGPYIQDLLGPYVKNKAIWLCPSINVNQNWPPYPDYPYHLYTWKKNGGNPNGAYAEAYTSYLWHHKVFPSGSDPLTKDGKRISGSLVAEIRYPTSAMTFLECPYWETADSPHAGSKGKNGVNVAYIDGHVKLEFARYHMFSQVCWPKGWIFK